jgi:hypothetical protein
MRKGRHPGAAHPTSPTRASVRPAPADGSARRQVSAARVDALGRRGRWAPGGDLLPYRPQSRTLQPPVQLDGRHPRDDRASPPPRVAPTPRSAAQQRPSQAPGPGSMRAGLGDSYAGPPAVEGLTETEPRVARDAFGRAVSPRRAGALGSSRPRLCKVADHPDVKAALSMSAHAPTHDEVRLIAAVPGATRPRPSSAIADALMPKEGG